MSQRFNDNINRQKPQSKLWLLANNGSFANGSKSAIGNNLGLCKHSEIYLI